MMSKSILMLVGDYAEDYKSMVPFQALHMVSIPWTLRTRERNRANT
jgi:hypothetical protein